MEYFQWDGIITQGQNVGIYAVGAFDVWIELLDRNWQSTVVSGSLVTQDRAVVIDISRWLLPLNVSPAQVVTSGVFMESGHLGSLRTGLHGGVDMYGNIGRTPQIISARSGFYTRHGDYTISLTHAPPDTTWYLHCDIPESLNLNKGQLVLQGEQVANMSNHLHFEWRTSPPETCNNPLRIISLRDECPPEINDIYLRLPTIGQAANLNNASTGINGFADLIVRCRDRAHPIRNTALDNGPFSIFVAESNGLGNWPRIEFRSFSATDHIRNYFSQQGQTGSTLTQNNHYLPYLRWDTAVYGLNVSPLNLAVYVADFYGQVTTRNIFLGPVLVLLTSPVNPVTTSNNPGDFSFSVGIENTTSGLSGIINDNYHIELVGALPSWTLSPARSGNVQNGNSLDLYITIHPNGVALRGTHNFEIVVSSNILRQVAARLPVRVEIS